MSDPRAPTDQLRRDAIAAAVAAYDHANPQAPLPRNAARLLIVMFASGDMCQRSQEAIAAEAEYDRARLPRALRRLVEAQLLSRERGSGRVPHTYHLHLPPWEAVMRGRCAPTDRSRRDEIAAAISPCAPRRMPRLADDALLRILIRAGIVLKERGVSRAPNTYRLLQPPPRQP